MIKLLVVQQSKPFVLSRYTTRSRGNNEGSSQSAWNLELRAGWKWRAHVALLIQGWRAWASGEWSSEMTLTLVELYRGYRRHERTWDNRHRSVEPLDPP